MHGFLEMIGEAKKRSEGAGLPVEFLAGDAQNLEFANDSFDSCRSDRTLQHVESPHRVLGEMVRVTRSGGRIVVSDMDWETLVIDSPHRDVTRKLFNLKSDTIVRNGWIGRQMPAMFKDAGLREVEVASFGGSFTDFELADQVFNLRVIAQRGEEAKVITKTDATQWLNHLEEAAERGRFFCAISLFIVSGTND